MECRRLDTGKSWATAVGSPQQAKRRAATFSRCAPGGLFIVPRMSKTPSPQTGHVHGPNCDHDHDHGDLDPSVFLAKQPFVRPEPKVGRNDPCPCGSGKKYKKCHGT